jgi:hypothetical protein
MEIPLPQTNPCGLKLFRLLSHANGSGSSTLLVDGFYVAFVLKELHPTYYALLSQIPIRSHAAGEPWPGSTYFQNRDRFVVVYWWSEHY